MEPWAQTSMASSPLSLPAPLPLCPRHPEQVAEKACARCGSYLCIHCSRSGDICRECILRNLAAVPSSTAHAKWAVRLFRFAGALNVPNTTAVDGKTSWVCRC
jgi:hypothetical protein